MLTLPGQTFEKIDLEIKLVHKDWELEKETKVNSESLLIKSSGIFLPAFYLITYSSKIFFKRAILKI